MTEVEELKEAVREAHQAIKDLRAEIKTAVKVDQAIKSSIPRHVGDAIATEVGKQLETLALSMNENIKRSTEKIVNRFEALANKLMNFEINGKKTTLDNIISRSTKEVK